MREYVEFPKQPKQDLRMLFTAAQPEAIDLLQKLLTLDPRKRITAKDVSRLHTVPVECDNSSGEADPRTARSPSTTPGSTRHPRPPSPTSCQSRPPRWPRRSCLHRSSWRPTARVPPGGSARASTARASARWRGSWTLALSRRWECVEKSHVVLYSLL